MVRNAALTAPAARLFETEAPTPDPVIAAVPIGTNLETAHTRHGLATASFDSTGRYRYRLSRVWDPALPRLAAVLLNPSTADHLKLDPTLTRVYGFAQAWGYGAFEILNLFGLRSPHPRDLRLVDDPVGPGNDDAILAGAAAADRVMVGWGINGTFQGRARHIEQLLDATGIEPWAWQLTKAGFPRHPLYIKATRTPSRYNPNP